LQKEVYEESRCYPLCSFSTCFLFMFLLVSYSSISLLVFMLTLIFIYCILTFFFFVYHFSCYIFVLFFFTCLFLKNLLLCKFSLRWPNFLFYCICWSACVLKTLPLCWILLVQNMSSFCCIVFLFIIVVMCSLLSCLFLFFYPFFPIVVQMSFTIDTCAFFSLMYTLEENDD